MRSCDAFNGEFALFPRSRGTKRLKSSVPALDNDLAGYAEIEKKRAEQEGEQISLEKDRIALEKDRLNLEKKKFEAGNKESKAMLDQLRGSTDVPRRIFTALAQLNSRPQSNTRNAGDK